MKKLLQDLLDEYQKIDAQLTAAGDVDGVWHKHVLARMAEMRDRLERGDDLHLPQEIDGKFHGRVFRNRDQCEEKCFVVFVPRDALLPALLAKYEAMLVQVNAGEEQVQAVSRLRERVMAWQLAHPTEVKIPDAVPGECP